MCCGQPSAEDIASVAVKEGAVSDDLPAIARAGNGQAELYTQVYGMELQLGAYGVAKNTTPAIVPEAVAIELARDKKVGKLLGPSPLAPRVVTLEPGTYTKDELAEAVEAAVEQDESADKPRRRERRAKE